MKEYNYQIEYTATDGDLEGQTLIAGGSVEAEDFREAVIKVDSLMREFTDGKIISLDRA